MVLVRRAAIALAPKFGAYPRASIAAETFSRVDCETRSGKLRQRETVAVETPALDATSCKVGVVRVISIVSRRLVICNLAVQFAKGKVLTGLKCKGLLFENVKAYMTSDSALRSDMGGVVFAAVWYADALR